MNDERKSDAPLLGIGAALASMREAAGISKRQMELRANIGRVVIDRIEKGRAACSTRTLHAYLEVCGIDLAELILGHGKAVDVPQASVKGKKGHDYSLLPHMSWNLEPDGTWFAFELLNGFMKQYRILENGTSWQRLEPGTAGPIILGHSFCRDAEAGKQAVNEWRFVHGYRLE